MKKIKLIILTITIILELPLINKNVYATQPQWEVQYRKILKNWRLVNSYLNTNYLKEYFGKDYRFDKYCLYDLNKDGIPELFLSSSSMGLTGVLTYKKKVIGLTCDNIYKVNKSKKEIIVRGHWHGAGGSYENEYTIYNISKNKMNMLYYIDNLDGYITLYSPFYKLSETKNDYKKIYNSHVKSATLFSSLKKYKLNDTTAITIYKNYPKACKISNIKPKFNGFIIYWNKQTQNVSGYQIQYSLYKNFKKSKILSVLNNKKTSKTINKLKSGKKYYVRIRTYNTIKINKKNKKLYSKWSSIKSIKTR